MARVERKAARILAVLPWFLWTAPRVFAGEGAEPPGRLALLVGIDRYAADGDAGVRPLSGAVRDVRRAREVLVGRLGFAAADVLVLEDEAATHQAIVSAFHRHLVGRAGPETEVVFWFSGHGSRVPDASGEAGVEEGGLESSFLAHDSRAGGRAGGHDIVDDELGSLLAALMARTPRVLLVLDTCHSGGGMRSGLGAARLVPPGSEPLDPRGITAFWPEDVPLTEDDRWARLDPTRFACIAASRSDELAYEIELEEGVTQGLLSYFLLEQLEQALPDTTLRDLADRTRLRVEHQRADQTVWTGGALDRVLLDGRFEPPPVGFEAHPATRDELRVEAGRLQLLRKGSQLSVRGEAGEELGLADVLYAGPTQSRARWRGVPAGLARDAVLRAVEISRPPETEPLRVHSVDPRLRELLAASELAAPADDRQGAYVLEQDPSSGALRLLDHEGVARMLQPHMQATDDELLGNAVDELLRAEIRWRGLFDLALEVGGLDVGLSVREATPDELEHWGRPPAVALESFDPAVCSQRARLHPDKECQVVLRIHNRSDRPLYVGAIDVSEDRSTISLLEKRDHRVEPGERIERRANLVWRSSWPLSRPMRDRLLLIATTQPYDFSVFDQETTLRSAPQLPEFLLRALEAGTTRSARRTDGAGWGLASLDLWLEPRPPESPASAAAPVER